MPFSAEVARFMIERGHWISDKTVLDVGSGAGIQADLISSLANINVTCLDMEPYKIENPRCRFVHGNALAMPFLSASFDGLYCSYLYHLIDDFKDSFLLECARVVKEDGYVFFVTTSERVIRERWLNRYFPSLPDIDIDRYGTIEDLKRRLKDLPLQDVGSLEFVRSCENPKPDFLEVLRTRQWSSLSLIDEIELEKGLRAVEQDWHDLVSSGIRWPEERTVVFGRVSRGST